MHSPNDSVSPNPAALAETNASEFSRRSFFKRAAVVGATGLVAAGGVTSLASLLAKPALAADDDPAAHGLKKGDRDILIAAEIAEALAVTTYTNIINTASFFTRLESDDQGY